MKDYGSNLPEKDDLVDADMQMEQGGDFPLTPY